MPPIYQASTAVPATTPPVPRRGRSIPSKDSAPRIEIRYSEVPKSRQKPPYGQNLLFLLSHRPSPQPAVPPHQPP